MAELDFLLWLQQFHAPVTNAIAHWITELGSENAYLALLTIVYLCGDHRFGFRVLVLFLLSGYLNTQIKVLTDIRRPWEVNGDILDALHTETGGGASFPSGHSQNAVVVWGVLAGRAKPWALRIALVVLIALIAFSRLFLQVHWPVDVVGGLCIGGLVLCVYVSATRAWEAGNRRLTSGQGAVLVAVVSALMLVLGYHEETCVQTSGALLGAGLGYILLERHGYSADAPVAWRVVRALVALAALFGLRMGGAILLGDDVWSKLVTYVAIGFVAAYILPLAFGVIAPTHRRGAP